MLFSLARFLVRHRIRGGHRLWRFLFAAGALNRTVRYPLRGAVRSAPLFVPLDRPETSLSEPEIAAYGAQFVAPAIRRVAEIGRKAVLIDCGADIGMIASAFVRDCAEIASVIAFEPNPEAFAPLAASLAGWSVPARAVDAAVADHAGRGRLRSPPDDHSAHARFLAPEPDGPIKVCCIDDETIDADAAVLLKIDVEGGEHAVVAGALQTLRRAPAFVVIFEAHPRVLAARGVDPCETLRLLRSIRTIDAAVSERPDFAIDFDRPFVDQLGERRDLISNIICVGR